MTEYWEDVIPDPNEDGVEAYLSFYDRLHEFDPGDNGRCKETQYRRDGSTYICNGYSHDTTHLPMNCCYCRHGVYLHTSYDIPCGTCEMEASYDYEGEDA